MRQIIHLDLDAFFASVEVLLNPAFKGKPLIVSMGYMGARSVVATASYEARTFGVHSAMPLRQALRLCPKAVVVPVRHHLYSEYSQRVMQLLREYSPLLEQVSIDEAYLEIEPGREAARLAPEIQKRIKEELGLDCTLAVATNKLVSKIACNTVKPRGLIVIPPGGERQFLTPLPVEKLPGAGRVTRTKLARWKVQTIGDLARVPVEELRAEFGEQGLYLHQAAEGLDNSPIATEARTKSISQENTFERDTRDAARLERDLAEMSEGVARELEHEHYLARTIVLKLRYADFQTITRQTTLHVPTADVNEIRACAQALFRAHWDKKRAVRLIGVGAHNFVEPSGEWQLELL